MRKTTYLLTLVCLSIPVSAKAADATAQPAIDCKSAARRPPGVDWKTYAAYCGGQASADRAKTGALNAAPGVTAACTGLPGGPCVADNLKSYKDLNFSGLPTFTDYDLWNQFLATRDLRYLIDADPNHPTPTPRRISWMYPDNGCFARAEQVDVLIENAQKPRPYKLFAMGDLRVFTDNHPSGRVEWGWHVVPVVKNTAGEVIVLDAALSPCRPLPWKEWLALMVNNIDTGFTNPAGGEGVALGDSWSYIPWSLASGEPSHSAESKADEENRFMRLEYDRQKDDLNRDPNVVLGASPPWSGYNCVSMTNVGTMADVAPGTNATLTTPCPFGTLAVGGAYVLNDPGFAVSKVGMSGNGWQIIAKNTGTSTQTVWNNAVCLIGATPPNSPTGAAYVTSIQGNVVNVDANSFASSTASCAAGKMVGGGYTTTMAGSPSKVMRIYKNGPTNSNTWQVSAQNTTSSQKTVTSFAYCLNNTSFSMTQRTSDGVSSSGIAGVSCPYPGETLMGGGWVFPRTTAYTVQIAGIAKNTAYFIELVPPPANGDVNAKAYAQCLTHP